MTAPRVVYVMHADPGEVSPAAALDRWPTAARTLAALAASGVVEVAAVGRTRGAATVVRRGLVDWYAVDDRSRVGWRIARRVRALRPDVIHVNGLLFAVPTIALRIACGRRPRIVVQHHGEPPASGRSRIAQRIARVVVDAYAFTGGHDQAQPWRDAGILADSTPVVDVLESASDVAPLERTQARQRTAMSGEPAIVWVGRLIAGKDPKLAIDAFARFAAERADAELWMLFADDTLLADAAARIADLDAAVAARVHLVGEVPHDEIAAWLSAADVVIATSRREGSGYALIEAITCGCTPVATDIAPHRAIVGELGPLVPVGDVAAMAAALDHAADHHDRSAARSRGASALAWSAVATQLLTAYGVGPPASTTLRGRTTIGR